MPTNDNAKWEAAVLQTVKRCAEEMTRFTTDHVWACMEPGHEARDGRALGKLMRRAKSLGWIETTAEFEISSRPECHHRPVRVWRSTL